METKQAANQLQKMSTRDGFGLGLVEAASQDDRVVGVCADLAESVRMQQFAVDFSDRFVEVGVAEQNLAGVAAGLAMAGKIPIAASYACFHPANSWGVIRTSICYANLPVILVGGHAGISTGQDGATHQSLEDLALMRVLPNMIVLSPADGEEARQAVLAALNANSPVYIRISKPAVPIYTKPNQFKIGQATQLRKGSSATIIATGLMVSQAMAAADLLIQQGISITVLNMSTIKPLDEKAVIHSAKYTKAILTVEDHQIIGGLGSAVAEVLAENQISLPFKRLGMIDQFGQSGTTEQLLKRYHLTPQDLVTEVKQILQR